MVKKAKRAKKTKRGKKTPGNKGARGQPTKLTPVVQKILVETVAVGAHYETACKLAGIDFQTLRNWMIRGEKEGKGIYFEFFESLTRAQAKCEVDMLEQWQRFMRDEIGIVEETTLNKEGEPTKTTTKEKILRYGDYRAIKDFLERRHRDRWGRDSLDIPYGSSAEITEIRHIIIDPKNTNR